MAFMMKALYKILIRLVVRAELPNMVLRYIFHFMALIDQAKNPR